MTDVFTRAERSEIMRRVRSRDTSPEWLLRRALWGVGARGYRLNVRDLPGKPDVVFRRARLAVFVDGCFWHGCPRHCRMPSSRRAYWAAKIQRNAERDQAASRALRKAKWRVIRFWEHEVMSNPERAAARVAKALGELWRRLGE